MVFNVAKKIVFVALATQSVVGRSLPAKEVPSNARHISNATNRNTPNRQQPANSNNTALLFTPWYLPPGYTCQEVFGTTNNDFDFLPFNRSDSGGGKCDCGVDFNTGGYVYAWKEKGTDGPIKVGCTNGDPGHANPCQSRMHAEMQTGQEVEYEYICFDASECDDYATGEVCNAGEWYLQDFLYCSGTWLGKDGTGVFTKPDGTNTSHYISGGNDLPSKAPGSNDSGKSEWFDTDFPTILTYAMEKCYKAGGTVDIGDFDEKEGKKGTV